MQATWVVPDYLLQPGNADQDGDFDQDDIVQVQLAGKYLSRQSTTWGEGDWNGGPGGGPGNPRPATGNSINSTSWPHVSWRLPDRAVQSHTVRGPSR